jgi:hypothetical protein
MERYKKINKGFNTKMKKRNKKKNNCNITTLWPTLEAMKKHLFIDLEKQEIYKVSNGKKFKKSILIGTGKYAKPYIVIALRINRINYKLRLHRLFFYWKHNYLPPLVDHIDGNSFNNDIENLRELNISGNTRNSHKIKKKTSSKYKGVCWNKREKKWQANLTINYKMIFLGLFNNEDDAGQAYNDKIRELGLEEVSVMNDTPQERARKLTLFDNLEPITNLK